ncbi:MrpH family fimbial adhesin [Serratia ureilytica]|uniref:MrpH family fimbial adhesin n=1 Tax=Serratia ureilytica TaxID=300181 RepID=UPI00191DDCD8|nr:hypothetical protein [Serratia ureilytica]MBL0877033.1 hypothetical protein [Serratia ureilytica]MDN2469292.1 hypothetical protein [Serratia ureilytica]
MRKWLFIILFGGIYLAAMSAAFAKISLNLKWTQESGGKWSLSISPQGAYELAPELAIAKCTGRGYWPCQAHWRIYVNGTGIECDPMVIVETGVTVATLATRVANAYNGKTCVLDNLVLNGTEKICVMTQMFGEWAQPWLHTEGGPIYATSGCSDGAVGGGETILPPIKPLSCSINNSISLAHGTIDYSEIGASQATYLATVSCTRQATVKITVPNGGKVNFKSDGSFYSLISVMDTPGGAQFSVNGSKQVKFSSRLYAVGDDTLNGMFNNSAVAVLNIL